MRSAVNQSSRLFVALSLLSFMGCEEEGGPEVPPAAWSTEPQQGGEGTQQPSPEGDGVTLPSTEDAALNPVEPSECEQLCIQLQGCPPQGFEEANCLQSCQQTPPEQRACILTSSCQTLESCFTPPPSGCQGACEHLSSCGLAGVEIESCVRGCEADDPARAECILGSACDATQTCFETNPPSEHCPAACERFIGCGFEIFEAEECVQVCQGHDPWRASCMLDAGCDEISNCMSAAPPPSEEDCQRAFEMEECVGLCLSEDASRAACMIEAECAVIADCMRGTP